MTSSAERGARMGISLYDAGFLDADMQRASAVTDCPKFLRCFTCVFSGLQMRRWAGIYMCCEANVGCESDFNLKGNCSWDGCAKQRQVRYSLGWLVACGPWW